MTTQYSAKNQKRLLQVARQSLEDYLCSGQKTEFSAADAPELLELRAVFVTLWERDSGDLRGCIGHTESREPLIDAVAETVISSAIDDPRFASVTAGELPNLRIEINVLSPMSLILPEEVEVGRHGLMLRKGYSGGLFLPEVPLSQGWDRLTFLDELCRKANLPKGAWKAPEAELYGFESESWEEN